MSIEDSKTLVDFLERIETIESPLKLSEYLKTNKLNTNFLSGVLPFLKILNVIEEDAAGQIYAINNTAKYFIKSLSVYIKNNAQIFSSWEPISLNAENQLRNITDFGIYFLKLIEEKRVNSLNIKDVFKIDHLVLTIIKSKLVGLEEDHYLFQYNLKTKKFQTFGGYAKENVSAEVSALNHLKEELDQNPISEKTCQLIQLENEFNQYGISIRNGVYTHYKVKIFQTKFHFLKLKLSSLDRWLSYQEICNGITDDGIEIMAPPLSDLKTLVYLKEIPLGFELEQENQSTFVIQKEDKDINFTAILNKYLKQDESTEIEFKSSARWDYRENKVNKELEKVIAKTIAAFMNSSGGYLFIGVNDDKEVVGIDNDIKTLNKKNEDGYIQFVINLVSNYFGVEFASFIDVSIEHPEDKVICVISVKRAYKPVFVRNNDDRDFYVRIINTSRLLNSEDTYKYIQLHW